MKLRIKGNTVRIRLEQKELDQLLRTGEVSESTDFPQTSLTYRLLSSKEQSVSLTNNVIAISLPNSFIDEWVNTDKTGFSLEIPTNSNTVLNLTVEKDFKCLTERPAEDESDMFPNPRKSH